MVDLVDYDHWEITARTILNAVVPNKVQQQFCMKGQGKTPLKKKAFRDTALYKVLEGMIEILYIC